MNYVDVIISAAIMLFGLWGCFMGVLMAWLFLQDLFDSGRTDSFLKPLSAVLFFVCFEIPCGAWIVWTGWELAVKAWVRTSGGPL